MTTNKPDPETLEKASAMLKAMAHPVRISIIELLEDKEKLTVTEIHKQLGIGQSVASHHLVILKDKGVLSSSREGKNIKYYLKNPELKGVLEKIDKCCRD